MSWLPLFDSTITRQGDGFLPIVLGQLTGSDLAIVATSATAPPHWRLALWLKLLVDAPDSPMAPAALEVHRQAILLNQRLLIRNPQPDLSCRAVLEIPPWHLELSIQAWQSSSAARSTDEPILIAPSGGTLFIGQPVCFEANEYLFPAIALNGAAGVVGFAVAEADPGDVGKYKTEGTISRTDWTPIAGTVELIPGQTYYLSPLSMGLITPEAPTESGQLVQAIGKALSSQTLDIEIQSSILL